MSIAIIGYEQDGHCEHCGRPLKHCIRISDGRIVGATCFDKKITKPKKTYYGKSYRIGSENVIFYAKCVQFGKMKQNGLSAEHVTFELA